MNNDNDFFSTAGSFIKSHRLAFLLALAGIIVAVLIIVAGFWPTLLILALGTAGGAGGWYLDRRRQNKENSDGAF